MIHVLTQLPLEDRYTAFWYRWLRQIEGFSVLGTDALSRVDRTRPYNWFAPLEEAVAYECDQLTALFQLDHLDALLICDLDYPGLAAAAIPALKLKFPQARFYGILHAGSWCTGDLFAYSADKQVQELAAFCCCDALYVATDYHRSLIHNRTEFPTDHIRVLNGFPFRAFELVHLKGVPKTKGILVLGRAEQMQALPPPLLSDPRVDIHDSLLPRDDYLAKLAAYQIAVFPRSEETFGYNVLEALAVGTLPLTLDAFAYPELLPRPLRFSNCERLLAGAVQALDEPHTYSAYAEEAASVPLGPYAQIFHSIRDEIELDLKGASL